MNPKKKDTSSGNKIAFVGAGKMAEAIISGLIHSKNTSNDNIIASDIDEARLSCLKKTYKIKTTSDNQKAIDSANTVVLSIKPQNFSEVLKELNFSKAKLIISIAAGITLEYLESKIGQKPIIRVMPNNPALVKKGISALAFGSYARKEDFKKALSIFSSVGEVVEVGEDKMDAVTALSGSGPAFIYLIIESMIDAAESLGLLKATAEKLAFETIIGSVETIKKTGKHAKELRAMVTSPGGTTHAGLEVLEKSGFEQALKDAIIAAARRSSELSQSA